MGFLEAGTPLDWESSQAVLAYVKGEGIRQLLHLYHLNKDRQDADVMWGEEIEYSLVELDSQQRVARVANYADHIIDELTVREGMSSDDKSSKSDWRPEYTNFMVEAIPGSPYNFGSLDEVLEIEPSMNLRRSKIAALLNANQRLVSLTAFPHMGVKDFMAPPTPPCPHSGCSHSVFLPDAIMSPHPRFGTLTRNIRDRRGAKVLILVPLEEDENTQKRSQWDLSRVRGELSRYEIEKLSEQTANPLRNYIYMDAMGFGMGCCCLQVTFGTPDVTVARYLFDQFTVLAPLFLALTASAPFQRGLVAATDTRWDTICMSVDCRTVEEMDTIHKSRYAGVSLYISNEEPLAQRVSEYNDVDVALNESAYQQFVAGGLDPILAKHFAYLFIRDPMVIFSDKVEMDHRTNTAHFENIQSTNWNSVRFKPPPPSPDGTSPSQIGWRVEFRTPEAQLTDFENAAVAAVVAVLARVIIDEKWDLYIPMSKNDENMARSSQRNAVLSQRFWFRHDIGHNTSNREYSEMTLNEILFGKALLGFPGIMNKCKEFIQREHEAGKCSAATLERLSEYMAFIEQRSTGELMTTAGYLRQYLKSHPLYQQDSVVPTAVGYEIADLAAKVGFGQIHIPEILGSFRPSFRPPPFSIPTYPSSPPLSPFAASRIKISPPSLPPLSAGAGTGALAAAAGIVNDTEGGRGGNSPSSTISNSRRLMHPASPSRHLSAAGVGMGSSGASPNASGSPATGPEAVSVVSSEDFTRCWLAREGGYKAGGLEVCSTSCATSTVCADDAALFDELPGAARLGFESNHELEYYRQIWGHSA
ncbi:unnamed protein product [Vitrella brassicaformis CCMP3155]|uniref:Glutamate--cysteine ligase n=2 Tax=Vitrella brassicaformis TaxID=1169539 RepID=A0A0G4ER78_VITBC|nr:unnamed protein product [Vitrella brassicaformis CCMP3155]|eukprot:CEM00430.1 unnamed protein product [Vitrella brassicaformis CCMP3155]